MYIQLDDEEEKRRDEGYKKVQMRGEQTCSTGVEGDHVPGGSTTGIAVESSANALQFVKREDAKLLSIQRSGTTR